MAQSVISTETSVTPDREPPTTANFRRMVVCLDRSESAEAILPLAAHLARNGAVPMTLFHVLESAAPDDESAIDALNWELSRAEAHAYLDGLVERTRRLGIATGKHVAEGSLTISLDALALEPNDVLALSTHHRGGLDQWPWGGRAHRILAVARGALLVAPASAHGRDWRIPLRCVLVPLDGSLRAETVLPTAIRIARADDAEIVVAHVIADVVRTEVLATDEDLELARAVVDRVSTRAAAYLDQIRARLVAAGVRARTVTRKCRDLRDGIVAIAGAERADLVVMSAHGAGCNPSRPLGSTTSIVLSQSTSPVLVLQDVPAQRVHSTSASLRTPSRASHDEPAGLD